MSSRRHCDSSNQQNVETILIKNNDIMTDWSNEQKPLKFRKSVWFGKNGIVNLFINTSIDFSVALVR